MKHLHSRVGSWPYPYTLDEAGKGYTCKLDVHHCAALSPTKILPMKSDRVQDLVLLEIVYFPLEMPILLNLEHPLNVIFFIHFSIQVNENYGGQIN